MDWLLLGASRGLGHAFGLRLKDQITAVVSRTSAIKMNFADESQWSEYLKLIRELRPKRIVYFAGGGPFGAYGDKAWKDHQWAFKVNFEFPAFLLHHFSAVALPELQQICVVGSAIAESSPDSGAASYSTAKHALKALVTNLHSEAQLPFDLRLFSPGYIDTALLPPNAWPRQREGSCAKPRNCCRAIACLVAGGRQDSEAFRVLV